MMRHRHVVAAPNSPTSTINYSDDVETCYSSPIPDKPPKTRRRSTLSRCSKHGKRLVAVTILVALAFIGYSHCQRAYEVYNLPGVKELLKEASPVLEGGEFVVFLTASTGEVGQTYVKMGRSFKSATLALMQAQAKLVKHTPSKFLWIKIDVVDEVQRIEGFDYYNSIDVDGNWFGIGLDWKHAWAFLPDEVQAQSLMDKDNVLRWEKLLTYALKVKKLKGWPIPDLSDDATNLECIDIFHTTSVFYDVSDDENNIPTPIPLYHGHRMYDEITPQILNDAIIDAGEYMVDSIDDSKKFVYSYFPRSDYEGNDGYDLSRHAAAIFTLSKLYSKWQDLELLEGIEKALEYLLSHVQVCNILYAPERHTANCIVEKDEDDNGKRGSNLGLNGLTVLAIAEYTIATKDKKYVNTAKSIAKWIGGMKRQEDGSFVHQVTLPNFENEQFHVGEYHGQVAFALSRLYHATKSMDLPVDEEWLNIAVAAVQFQVAQDNNDQDGVEEQEAFAIDHWLMYAIGDLPSDRVNADFVDHAMYSARMAIDRQNGEMDGEDEDDQLDELGIFNRDLSATRTAMATEGLCTIHGLAIDKGHDEEAEAITDSVVMGLRYQLQSQYRPETAIYMRDPKRIVGGFHESIVETEMRLAHTYHNLASILCAQDMLARQASNEATE